MSILQIMEAIAKQHEDTPKETPRLGDLIASYNRKEEFRPGDVVVWKEGMRYCSTPEYDQECIVMEVLESPIYKHDAEVGQTDYKAPHDLQLAMKMQHGSLAFALFDSRRFTLKRRFEE